MYYVFSNAKKIAELAEQKKWEELSGELANAKLVIPQNYHGVCPSAKEVYRKVCDMLWEDEKPEFLKWSVNVSKLFADAWDVAALSMMMESVAKFGEIHEDGVAVLEEFKHYKALTLAELKANPFQKSFEKEKDGVKIVFKSGRLSFYKNGIEYLVLRTVAY